jgi:long-chain acyl-CoA synthetase
VQACIAAQAAGGVSAGIYSSCSSDEVAYVLAHCEAPFVVVENGQRFREQIEPILDQLPALQKVILIESDEMVLNDKVILFSQVLELGRHAGASRLTERREHIRPEGVSTLIYTSGTTGPPKAVMLSHRSVAWTVNTAVTLMNVCETDTLVSYLPLAHIAEQMFSVYAPMFSGLVLYFAESMDKLPDNLKEVQPTVFFGVPRVYEKFYDKVQEKVSSATGVKRVLLTWARAVATQYWEHHHASQAVSPALKVQYRLAKKLVFDKLKPLLGLGAARLCVTGAAPISQEIIQFFMGLDIPIYEVYGQSEDTGPASFNIPGATRLGTVGRPLPGLELKIAEDGEILVRGPSIFSGYLKDQPATDEAIKGGWLYSGDVGHLDEQGFLKITDRKKDLLITAGGKNISPQNLEGMLKQNSLVSQAVVIGDQKKYLVALLTPQTDNLLAFADKLGIRSKSISELVKNKLVHGEIQRGIDAMNEKLAPAEQIKKFILLSRDFSIEDGELTPTMKVKRKVINARYQERIESLYV